MTNEEHIRRLVLTRQLVAAGNALTALRHAGWAVPREVMSCCGTGTEHMLNELGKRGVLLAFEHHIAAEGVALMTHALTPDDYADLALTLHANGLHIVTSTAWRDDYLMHQLRYLDDELDDDTPCRLVSPITSGIATQVLLGGDMTGATQ